MSAGIILEHLDDTFFNGCSIEDTQYTKEENGSTASNANGYTHHLRKQQ